MDALAVAKRAVAAPRCDLFVPGHIEHYTRAQNAVARDRDRDGILRVAMKKVGGPIQGIGDYDDSLACDHRRRQLLAEDACIRKTSADDVPDRPLRCLVHFADEIRASLRLPHQLLALIRGVSNDACSATSRFQSDVEQLGIAAISL